MGLRSLRLMWPSALVLIAGCAHAFSIAWPFKFGFSLGAYFQVTQGQPIWWLHLVAMGVLAWQLNQAATKRQGAWVGWLFACTMQVATWWWLYISLHTYGGLAAPLTVLAIVGLAAFLALYYAAAGALFVALAPANRAGRAALFAALWLLAELCRVALFTGFPWGQGGYAQLDGPFVSLAKLVGVHGLTFGAVLLAGGLATVWHAPRRLPVSLVAGGVLCAAVGSQLLGVSVVDSAGASGSSYFSQPQVAPSASSPFTVALLQGNIAQDEKFKPTGGLPDALQWYGEQLLASTATLVVTPETALPLLPEQLPEGYLVALIQRFTQPGLKAADQAVAQPSAEAAAQSAAQTLNQTTAPPELQPSFEPKPSSSRTAALIGIPLGTSQAGYTNSVIALKPEPSNSSQAFYQYDKHHLVPFGEFVHPLFKWFLAIVNIPLSDFNRGDIKQPSFDWQGQRIAPNICYEDLFGEELAARFIDPALAPTMMVNISNIGWFGNTIAIDQHLNISRLRSIEFERPMIRATNTGATAIIDHRGQVTHALERHTRGVLVGAVGGRTGNTPYASWAARFGLWPWWLLIVAIVSVAACARFNWAEGRFKSRNSH